MATKPKSKGKAAKKAPAAKAAQPAPAVAMPPEEGARTPGQAVTKFVPKDKAGFQSSKAQLPKENGNREFLLSVFTEPHSVDAAAAKLEARLQIPNIEGEKLVVAFLDKAAADPDLDTRRKKEGNEWVYLIKPVPPGAQGAVSTGRRREMAKNGKTAGKRAAKPKGEKKPGVIATMLRLLSEKERTKEEIVAALTKAFPDRAPESMASTFAANFGGSNPFQQRERGHKVTTKKQNGTIYYKVVLTKA